MLKNIISSAKPSSRVEGGNEKIHVLISLWSKCGVNWYYKKYAPVTE